MESTDPLAAEDFCYVTTTGRRTGSPHKIEIWFGLAGSTVYILSGGGDRSDWVRNMAASPAVHVRIADRTFLGHARIVEDPAEDRMARDLLFGKYEAGYNGDLTNWRDQALPVAIDLDPATAPD
jgi:deazaflavin-dependent oxidoreductase (nitroreductase family)